MKSMKQNDFSILSRKREMKKGEVPNWKQYSMCNCASATLLELFSFRYFWNLNFFVVCILSKNFQQFFVLFVSLQSLFTFSLSEWWSEWKFVKPFNSRVTIVCRKQKTFIFRRIPFAPSFPNVLPKKFSLRNELCILEWKKKRTE